MTRTFLVAIDLPDDADVNAEADQISFLLSDDYTVSSVKPWASPALQPQISEDLPTIL
jgi:hypothetical protein